MICRLIKQKRKLYPPSISFKKRNSCTLTARTNIKFSVNFFPLKRKVSAFLTLVSVINGYAFQTRQARSAQVKLSLNWSKYPVIRLAPNLNVPSSRLKSPIRIFKRVVLPQPLSPKRKTRSPFNIKACVLKNNMFPKRFLRPSTSNILTRYTFRRKIKPDFFKLYRNYKLSL